MIVVALPAACRCALAVLVWRGESTSLLAGSTRPNKYFMSRVHDATRRASARNPAPVPRERSLAGPRGVAARNDKSQRVGRRRAIGRSSRFCAVLTGGSLSNNVLATPRESRHVSSPYGAPSRVHLKAAQRQARSAEAAGKQGRNVSRPGRCLI